MSTAISKEKAVERITSRYYEQVQEFPMMAKHISLPLYVQRNVRNVMRNGLLARYDPDHKDWCRFGFECHTAE